MLVSPILFLGFYETNLKVDPGDEALFASLRGLRRQLVGAAGSRHTARLLVADHVMVMMGDLGLAVSRSIFVVSAVVLDDHVNIRLQALPVIPIISNSYETIGITDLSFLQSGLHHV